MWNKHLITLVRQIRRELKVRIGEVLGDKVAQRKDNHSGTCRGSYLYHQPKSGTPSGACKWKLNMDLTNNCR